MTATSHYVDTFKKIMTAQALIASAVATALTITTTHLANKDLFGVSLIFVAVVSAFMVIDWCLGVWSSVVVHGERFESNKIGYTVMKFFTFFAFLFFVKVAKDEWSDGWANDMFLIIQTFVLILIGLREFVSVGEKMEKIWGDKPYLFKLVDDLFESLEKLFKKKIDNLNKD